MTKKEQELVQRIAEKDLKIDYDLHPVCQRCIYRHVIEKKLAFEIHCTPLAKDHFKTPDRKFDSNEAKFWYQCALDKDFYARHACGMEDGLRNAQKEILFCNSKRRVLRLPRQTGKTIAMGIEALHFANTHKNKRVIIVVPFEHQIRNIFEKMDEMIRLSPILGEHFKKFRGGKYFGSNPFEIACSTTGSRISGFNVNQSGGISIRGQTSDEIIMDEVDYIVPEAIAAVFSMMTSNPNMIFIAGSTPKGTKDFFYDACFNPKFHEVHYKFKEIESYSPEIEADMRSNLSVEDFRREINAEFILQESGVFNPEFLNKTIEDYDFDTLSEVQPGIYTIGVDWNEGVAGVHIVVLKFVEERNKFVPTNVIIVPPSEFTQLEAVNKILMLNDIYKPKKILVDQGFGETQIQMLKKHGNEFPETQLKDTLVVLGYSDKVERIDPFTKQPKKVQLKPLIVEVSVRYLEKGLIVLPKSLDAHGKMVAQIRNYKIERLTENNVPKYSKGYVHTMEAWMNAIYGMWLLSSDNYLSKSSEWNQAKPAIRLNKMNQKNSLIGQKKFHKTKKASFGNRDRGFLSFGRRI